MADPSPLETLPDNVAELAAAVPAAARAIALASADRWFRGPGESDTHVLTSARLNWRFFFQRKTGWSFLFFHDEKTWIPLDARLSTLALPAAAVPQPLDAVQLLLSFPPLLWTNPTSDDLKRFAPTGSTPDNCILFRLRDGNDILGVRIDRRRLVFSPASVPLPEEPAGGTYPVLPFVALAETLIAWFAAGLPARIQDAQPLPGSSADRPVRQVIERIAEAWRRGYNSLANATAPANPFYSVNWRAAAFATDAQIRLDMTGQIAKEQGDERFSILLHMASRGSAALLQITAAPGAISAALLSAILDTFQNTRDGNRALAAALGAPILPAHIPPFIQSARSHAHIVRLEKDRDADWVLMILTGVLTGRDATVIAIAPMHMNDMRSPPSAGLNLDFDVAVLNDPFDHPLDARTDDISIEHLFAWIENFRRWVGLIL